MYTVLGWISAFKARDFSYFIVSLSVIKKNEKTFLLMTFLEYREIYLFFAFFLMITFNFGMEFIFSDYYIC